MKTFEIFVGELGGKGWKETFLFEMRIDPSNVKTLESFFTHEYGKEIVIKEKRKSVK